MAIFDERKFIKEDLKINLLLKKSPEKKSANDKKKDLEDLKRWQLALHISPIVGLVIGFTISPFALYIFPIMIGLYKNQSLILSRNCVNLLNYLLSWTLYSLVMGLILIMIIFATQFEAEILIGFTFFLPMLCLLFLLNIIYQIYSNAKFLYPLKINIIRLKIDEKS